MNRRSDVAAVLCIAGPTLRRSFELPVKRARSFDRRSNVPGLMIGTGYRVYCWMSGEADCIFGIRESMELESEVINSSATLSLCMLIVCGTDLEATAIWSSSRLSRFAIGKAIDQGSPTCLKLRATSCLSINAKGNQFDTHFWNKILLNLPSIILVLIFVNVKTLIMLMLFLKQARGRPTWSLRLTWCPRAPR